jgi:hypothetical protein
MSKSKWSLLAAGSTLAIMLVVLVLPAEPGVSRRNYSRIQIGMHKSEAESLFGGPSADAANVPVRWLGLFLT